MTVDLLVREVVAVAGLVTPGTLMWCGPAGRFLPVLAVTVCDVGGCPHEACVIVRFPRVGPVHFAPDAPVVTVVIDV